MVQSPIVLFFFASCFKLTDYPTGLWPCQEIYSLISIYIFYLRQANITAAAELQGIYHQICDI